MSIDLNKKELDAMKAIRNSVVHFGFVPSVRQLMNILDYKSTHSVSLILNKLIKAGFLSKKDGKIKLVKDLSENNSHAMTINIPILGSAPCGLPFMAEENIETYIPVSVSIAKKPFKYFLLHAVGDSMNNKGINDGDLVLVRQQETAENGDTVVALVDNESTIKELHYSENVILLKPRSKNKSHKPIIVSEDFKIQGKVITTMSNFL